jgi:hypothetical protein
VFEAQVVEAVMRKVALVMHDHALNRNLSLRGLLDASLAPLQTRNLPLPVASQALSRLHLSAIRPYPGIARYPTLRRPHRYLLRQRHGRILLRRAEERTRPPHRVLRRSAAGLVFWDLSPHPSATPPNHRRARPMARSRSTSHPPSRSIGTNPNATLTSWGGVGSSPAAGCGRGGRCSVDHRSG